jgi:hypothetical protein
MESNAASIPFCLHLWSSPGRWIYHLVLKNEWPIGFRRYRTITATSAVVAISPHSDNDNSLTRQTTKSHSVSSQQAIWPNICAAYSSGISFRVLLYGHFISTITHRVWSRRVINLGGR